MLGVLIGFCALMGLAIGSFLNVVIYRVPTNDVDRVTAVGLPVVWDTITETDNIPVSRGSCCGDVAAMPRVDLAAVPAGRVGCAASSPGRQPASVRLGASGLPGLFAGLLALSVIDVELLLLPEEDRVPAPGAVTALLVAGRGDHRSWHDFLVGALSRSGWFVVFFADEPRQPTILGFGDVRLAPVLGLALGWLGVGYVSSGSSQPT